MTHMNSKPCNISYTIIVFQNRKDEKKSDPCKDTIPTQLDIKFDPNIGKTTNLNQQC